MDNDNQANRNSIQLESFLSELESGISNERYLALSDMYFVESDSKTPAEYLSQLVMEREVVKTGNGYELNPTPDIGFGVRTYKARQGASTLPPHIVNKKHHSDFVENLFKIRGENCY